MYTCINRQTKSGTGEILCVISTVYEDVVSLVVQGSANQLCPEQWEFEQSWLREWEMLELKTSLEKDILVCLLAKKFSSFFLTDHKWLLFFCGLECLLHGVALPIEHCLNVAGSCCSCNHLFPIKEEPLWFGLLIQTEQNVFTLFFSDIEVLEVLCVLEDVVLHKCLAAILFCFEIGTHNIDVDIHRFSCNF